jgi:hypothetical protein
LFSILEAPDRPSAIAHRPLPLSQLTPGAASARCPRPPTPTTLAIGRSDQGLPARAPSLLCMRLHALHRSLFAACVIRLPLHRRAYRHSCVCVRTPSINLDLSLLHAPYASPPPTALVLSCAPHSDPELDLVHLHCCLRCVQDHRPFLFLELLWLRFCVRFVYQVSHFTHVSYLEGHIDIGSIHFLASFFRAPLGAHRNLSPPLA